MMGSEEGRQSYVTRSTYHVPDTAPNPTHTGLHSSPGRGLPSSPFHRWKNEVQAGFVYFYQKPLSWEREVLGCKTKRKVFVTWKSRASPCPAAQLLGASSRTPESVGLIAGQATHLSCSLMTSQGASWGSRLMFLSLSLSLHPLLSKINQ